MTPKRLPRLIYWDSTCFLAWLRAEKGRVNDCRDVLNAAKRGELRIATSTITLAEVVKLDKGKQVALTSDQETKIRKFFQRSYIVLIQVSRTVAEEARSLIWKHGLNNRDAVHFATARASHITEIHAYDQHFLDLDRKFHNLSVCMPQVAQPSLPLDIPGQGTLEDLDDDQVH
jgi:predicted nucleic acid-binding protein